MTGNDRLLIGLDNADRHPAGILRDDRLVALIAAWIELDADVLEARADLRAHGRGVLADAAGEDEQIEPPKYSCKRPDGLARRVTEERDRVIGGMIGRATVEQVAHVIARSRD